MVKYFINSCLGFNIVILLIITICESIYLFNYLINPSLLLLFIFVFFIAFNASLKLYGVQ